METCLISSAPTLPTIVMKEATLYMNSWRSKSPISKIRMVLLTATKTVPVPKVHGSPMTNVIGECGKAVVTDTTMFKYTNLASSVPETTYRTGNGRGESY